VKRKRGLDGNGGSKANLLWLATNSCSAHIISYANSCRPTLREALQQRFNFIYDSFIMAAEGENAIRFWYSPEAEEGDFILVVEGTVPTAFGGRTTLLGHLQGRNITALEMVKRLGSRARQVVAAGTCASFGGPFAAWPNPVGSKPLSAVLNRPVINVPGCPTNPGWLMETLELVRQGKDLQLDRMGRPRTIYGTTVHSLCQRLHLYEAGIFAEKPGDKGCMYNLGCKGPVTRADCPERRWIEERSGWNVGVNTPCIGCTTPEFPDGMSPFFSHTTDIHTPAGRVNVKEADVSATVFTLAAIAAHLTGNLITGRIRPQLPMKAGKTTAGIKKLIKRLKKR
jgi:hydrogenase small subunit